MDDVTKQKNDDSEEKRLEEEEELEELDDELDEEEQKEHEEESELKKLEGKVESLEDQLKRAVADYRNLEKRVRDERIEFVKYANRNLIAELLPAFDTLILASKYTDDENFKIAVKHVLDVLKTVGVERVETVGKKFDPAAMEVIEVVEGEKDKVVEETQPGFTLYEKVIRPARVKVGGKE